MKSFRVLLHPAGRGLISLLISSWGLPLLLLGMTILAGSSAAYLRSGYDPQARVRSAAPHLVPIHSRTMSRVTTTGGLGYDPRCWTQGPAFAASVPETNQLYCLPNGG